MRDRQGKPFPKEMGSEMGLGILAVGIIVTSFALTFARWIFWLSAFMVVYAYAGYPIWLMLRRRWRSLSVNFAEITPSVSIVMAVKNEAVNLTRKLENLAQLEYPREKVEVIVVSDGSTDATNDILTAASAESPGRVRAILLTEPLGKAAALNRAIAAAHGEIVVFVDARQRVDLQALRFLAGNFADPAVGCVSGELMLVDDLASSKAAVGLYWKIEKAIRKFESETGSVMGATGALYAVRRELLSPLPPGTLLDDVYTPFLAIQKGKRVIFEPRAEVYDKVASDWRHEFRRKVRTLTGCYQLVQLAPWLLTGSNPYRFEFFSHKLLRLFVPFALVVILACSLLVPEMFYRGMFVAQLGFYALALLPMARPGRKVPKLASLSFTFVMLNVAAALGFVKFVTGRKDVWVPSLQPERAP